MQAVSLRNFRKKFLKLERGSSWTYSRGERNRKCSVFPGEETRSSDLILGELPKKRPRVDLAKESHEVMVLAFRCVMGDESSHKYYLDLTHLYQGLQ